MTQILNKVLTALLLKKFLKQLRKDKLKIYDANTNKIYYIDAKKFLKRWGL